VVPSLVLKTVGIMRRVRRAFEAFDNLDQDLAQFIKLRVFPRCHGHATLNLGSSDQTFKDLDLPELYACRVPSDTQISLRSRQAKCSLVTRLMA
jgi:hypothetical protein